MPRWFKSEPGVVVIDDNNSATLFTASGKSWEVKASEILNDEASPEISEEEFNSFKSSPSTFTLAPK